ncbi:hypothetical protein HNQ70_001256 [Quisquiliibacterium transsilvanicum]|uniref:Uncharacterized protein n=1 Tax=Quisquiliibacterium transsilvanicum TaxID=1549638 RepID=A0A7W8HG64_9BURK|nr:hypothetical protein [Quisquiliibacterium transsilvanicum]
MKIRFLLEGPRGDGRDYPVESIATGKIYYLGSGRNAWHSTWSMRYYPDAFHITQADAKHAAEKRRTQGAVFYVSELPALVLVTRYSKYVITQINTGTPLLEYRHSLALEPAAGASVRLSGVTCPVAIGFPVGNAIDSFRADSAHWRHRPPKQNSVLIMRAVRTQNARFNGKDYHLIESYKDAEIDPLIGAVRRWSSFPRGENRSLGWIQAKPRVHAESVLALSARLRDEGYCL